MTIPPAAVAACLNICLLGHTLSTEMLERAVRKAREWRVRSVVVPSHFVCLAKSLLRDTGILVGTMVDFPHGTSALPQKVWSAHHCISTLGADEVGVVLNPSLILDGKLSDVRGEVRSAIKCCDSRDGVFVCFQINLLSSAGRQREFLEALAAERARNVQAQMGLDGMPNLTTPADCGLIRSTIPDVRLRFYGGRLTNWESLGSMSQGAHSVTVEATRLVGHQ